MAKSIRSKTNDTGTKGTSSYSKKNDNKPETSTLNPSRYAPVENTGMNEQLLEPEDGLKKLFTDCIKDLYWAENHLVKSLPKMAKSASSKGLADAITTHLEQTRTHVKRLERVFEILNKDPQAKKCDAMEGLTKEGEAIIEDTDSGTAARDLGIIMASQKVEHYEISAYTGLVKLSYKLGLPEIADLLSETLAEEEESDAILSTIADSEYEMADKDNE